MWEIFTNGGGDLMVNVFNAVAAWSGGGGFRGLIQVALVMGLTYALLVMAFNLDWKALFHWFLASSLIYGVLMIPTASIKVTDRTNPGLAPAVVDNVPLGLAAIASYSSQIGDWMTRQAETVFVTPAALNMTGKGMIYGSKLLDKSYDFEFTDPTIRANLEEYHHQCLFYDILLGFKNTQDLTNSESLIAAIGPGSPARAMRYVTPGSSSTGAEFKTCQDGLVAINAAINAHMPDAIDRHATKTFPGKAIGAARTQLLTDLPQLQGALFGSSSGSATDMLKQKAVIESFRRARSSFNNSTLDSFAQERAEVQAGNTYASIAGQAMTWVPLLNIVLTIVFYAMFPVLFPLFLFPRTGVRIMKGYMTGFFYLAAWGPLYAVIHMIVMNRLALDLKAATPNGMTLVSYTGIREINGELAQLAGFLLMSVPFIAAGMAKGAMAIAGHATSMLQPAQNAAEAAAQERTTGNYGFENRSFMNYSGNMVQANQWSTAPNMTIGGSRVDRRSGAGLNTIDYSGDGDSNRVYEASGVITQGAENFSVSNVLRSSRALEYSKSTSQRESAEESYRNVRSSGSRDSISEGTSSTSVTGNLNSSSQVTTKGNEKSSGGETRISETDSNRTDKIDSTSIAETASETVSNEEGFKDIRTSSSRQSTDVAGGLSLGKSRSGGKAGGGGLGGNAATRATQTWSADDTTRITEGTQFTNSTGTTGTQSETANKTASYDKNLQRSKTLEADREYDRHDNVDTAQDYSRIEDAATSSTASERYSAAEISAAQAVVSSRAKENRWAEVNSLSDEDLVSSAPVLMPAVVRAYDDYRNNDPAGRLANLPDPNDVYASPAQSDARAAKMREILNERISNGDSAILSSSLRRDVGSNATSTENAIAAARDEIGGPSESLAPFPASPKGSGRGQGGPIGGAVETTLPRSGAGYRTYSPAGEQVGTAGFVGRMTDLAQGWQGNPISYGDISNRGCGPMAGHEAHQLGRNVDIRPFRKDGKNKPVTWRSRQYDRDQTRRLVQQIHQENPGARIFFNDPKLVKEGLTEKLSRHDNHLHWQQ